MARERDGRPWACWKDEPSPARNGNSLCETRAATTRKVVRNGSESKTAAVGAQIRRRRRGVHSFAQSSSSSPIIEITAMDGWIEMEVGAGVKVIIVCVLGELKRAVGAKNKSTNLPLVAGGAASRGGHGHFTRGDPNRPIFEDKEARRQISISISISHKFVAKTLKLTMMRVKVRQS